MQRIALLIGLEEPSVFGDYLDQVANQGLLEYRQYLQWGGKQGESLYTHILNGVQVLETVRPHLNLTDDETRVLFTAFTIHDLNKAIGKEQAFGKLATREGVAAEIERLRLSDFLPDWLDYLEDITSLVRGHSGHHHSGGERWIVKREPVYRLGLERVNALLHLMRAADIVDLSHTLDERIHKSEFLGNLNTYLADSGEAIQYALVTHRLTEQRGILTNIIHNSIVTYLHEHYRLIPLLYYPNGVAYLVEKERTITIDKDDIARMGTHIADTISDMTTGKFEEFIESTGQGIKVDSKCLELGIPFRQIWREIHNLVQRRNPDPADLDSKARDWAQRGFNKSQKAYPAEADRVRSLLDSATLLVSGEPDRLRLAELIRSYYIFLNRHFAKSVPDAWERIYRLLELPESQWPYYAYFEALYARAYVLSRDLAFGEEEVYRRIEQDGEEVTGSEQGEEDAKVALFTHYLTLYAVFDVARQSEIDFGEHLAHYTTNQHQQCVYCSGPFATDKWMSADVRSDITVQTFSNRLRGGPGEPKKHICAVCQIQFLLEKLNYPEVRSEKTLYLHLYPYSFLTRPFIEGLNATVRRIVSEDTAVQALNMNVSQAMDEYLTSRTVTPTFRSRTEKNRPQPFGIYLPRFAETTGNLLVFPINPGGDNDTERFLFALWNALLLQRHFGVKVLMSDMAVPPMGKDQIPDLYLDNIPLACQGLLLRNDYAQFENGGGRPGPLEALWTDVGHLFALRRITFTTADNTAYLVRALVGSPLEIFYETEKLLEARVRGQSQRPGALFTRLAQEAFSHVQSLALSKGGIFMSKLSMHLQRLAEIAWQNGLRGRSLEKSSLLFPLDAIFLKLNYAGGVADQDVLKAAVVQEIFDHLSRIADERYKPGRKKWDATKQFVDGWFDGVLNEVYSGNRRKLVSDEKLIRSAFHFYIREQISSKAAEGTEFTEEEIVEEA
jgi:CRISPR-associated protein Csc3